MEIRRNRAENKALKGSSVLKKNRTADMTTGSLLKKIILFSVPLVFTGPLQLVYNTADTVIVGRFAGKQALATVVSQYISVSLILICLIRSDSVIKINCKELRLHKQELLEIVRIGVPAGMPFYITCSLQDVAAGQIRGLGKSAEPMLVSLVGTCGVRLLWIFAFLPMNRTLMNLFIAYPLSWAITFIAQAVLYAIFKKRI